jgi:hypothetical protein
MPGQTLDGEHFDPLRRQEGRKRGRGRADRYYTFAEAGTLGIVPTGLRAKH